MKKGKKNIVVGVKAFNYPENRNFAALPFKEYKFEKKVDFYKFPAYVYFKLKHKPHPYWLNYFHDFNLGRYHLLHFFNAINIGDKPWITTFEYYLPRGVHQYGMFPEENGYIDFVFKRLADPSCKKLIALSNFAFNAQMDYIKAYGKYEDVILKKMLVLHPSQEVYFNKIEEKKISPSINLVFVGADFFRKGGLEILKAIDILLKKNENIKLTIVSKMQYGDYASKSTQEDLTEALAIIDKHDSIIHYSSLPNSDVIELFKNGSIALLPTYDETYGYTVLEAQASGCPVISTNGGALTEINNNDCGWIIEVPLTKDKRSIPRTDEVRLIFKNNVINGIVNIIESVISSPEIIRLKAQMSLDRIKKHHSIKNATDSITEIYDSIIK